MKAFAIPTLTLIISLLVASASAQTNTDEARTLAGQAIAEQQRDASAHLPVAEPVAAGDYRARAQQRDRVLQWQATQRAMRAYAAGARSQPLPLTSGESARAEAQRVHAEQALAERAAVLRHAASAR